MLWSWTEISFAKCNFQLHKLYACNIYVGHHSWFSMTFSEQEISKVRKPVYRYSFQRCFTLYHWSGLSLAVVNVNFVPNSVSHHNNFHSMLQKCDWLLWTALLLKICIGILVFLSSVIFFVSFVMLIQPVAAFTMSSSKHLVCNIWLSIWSVRFYLRYFFLPHLLL